MDWGHVLEHWLALFVCGLITSWHCWCCDWYCITWLFAPMVACCSMLIRLHISGNSSVFVFQLIVSALCLHACSCIPGHFHCTVCERLTFHWISLDGSCFLSFASAMIFLHFVHSFSEFVRKMVCTGGLCDSVSACLFLYHDIRSFCVWTCICALWTNSVLGHGDEITGDV